MKKTFVIVLCVIFFVSMFAGCASDPTRYNTQRGAGIGGLIGGVIGAMSSQSHTWQGLLIGATIGTLVGAIAGNSVDQQEQAKRDALNNNSRVVYYDNHNGAVEVVPEPINQRTDCRKVTTNIYENGQLVKSKIEEVCTGHKTTQSY